MFKKTTDTKADILKVALQLFLQKGYKNVSYQDIVKKTGLSKGAIYHYFTSKEDLLASVFTFLLSTTGQPDTKGLENRVKDIESFRKVFIRTKTEQIKGFTELTGDPSIKFNKVLFFLEAINESEELKKVIRELMQTEIEFLKRCFLSLKNHGQLPQGKDAVVLAENLYWILQGKETLMLFMPDEIIAGSFIKMYNKTVKDFFKNL